jgi:hypothetical protein
MHPIILILVPLICLAGCSANNAGNQSPRAEGVTPTATQPTTFTGTLRGGMMAIGGETTGWTLIGDAQTGGIMIDVSKVQGQAKRLEGQRVTITGRMGEKDYVERGKTPVLIAQRIDLAPEPARR